MTKTLKERVNEALEEWHLGESTIHLWAEIIEEQQARIEELEEYEWKYKDLQY